MWVTERIQLPIQNIESIENEKENGKKILHFVGNLSRNAKLSLFLHSSTKTVLREFYSFLYIYLFIYICIYIKN